MLIQFLTLLALAPDPIAPTTVAILPLSSQVLDSGALEGIGSALGSELLNLGKFRVMERSQISSILQEQGFQHSGACDGGTCAVEVGKLLSVEQIVLGTVAKVGRTYSLTARLVNVQSGEVLKSSTRNSDAKVDALLTEAVPATASDLSGMQWTQRKKGSIWPWIVGASVVASGASAAAILMGGSGSSGTPPTNTPASPSVDVKVQVP
ncbi:MAG: CsgG/HfaB family protein [Fibrobacterota bacterium]